MSKSSSANPRPLLRVVFDTNVYIAALLRPGLSEELVSRGLRGEFMICSSEYIFTELRRKLADKQLLPIANVAAYINFIKKRVEIIAVTTAEKVIARDPDDDHILACAQCAKANLIITLDQDLLQLKEWRGIAIMHPKTFSWIV